MAEENHWQLIAVEEFQCPTLASSTRLHLWWHRVLRTLGLNSAVPSEASTESLPEEHQEFARAPAVAALYQELAPWMQEPEVSVSFLLDPPFSGSAAIARDWAKQYQWLQLTPPSTAQMTHLAIDEWWQQQATHHAPWLIDDLARYLLRTVDGLAFIRALLPMLLQGDLGKGLVVCDSWTFSFLRNACSLSLPRLYCFAPAKSPLLQQVGINASDRHLERLAGQARGNLGLALAIWQTQSQTESKQSNGLPTLPLTANDTTAFILYALLVHRGLTGSHLQQVLPNVAAEQLNMQLLTLAQIGIVERQQQWWQLQAQGYLAVREFLSARGYLMDNF